MNFINSLFIIDYVDFIRLIRHYVEEDDAASVITSEEGNVLENSNIEYCFFFFLYVFK